MNSVYSENSSATTSESNQWLSVTLIKRELDKACKDSNNRIFASDFKASRQIDLIQTIFLIVMDLLLRFPEISDYAVLHSSWSGAFKHRGKSTQYGFRRSS